MPFIKKSEDITIQPTRMQSEVANETEAVASVHGTEQSPSPIPSIMTLERAITYYETHATGELASLYKFTAIKLRSILNTPPKAE